jgi:hypothetical protein
MDAFWFALSLTFLAGIATMIGAILATLKKFTSRSGMAVSLGFSAGAILYVSLTDILGKSTDSFTEIYNDPKLGYGMMALAFFVGIGIMVLVDRLIPTEINLDDQEGKNDSNAVLKRKLLRGGLFIGLALCLHNFPEGFLVFMTAYDDPSVGIAIAVALAIHNVPEGIAIAGPLYAASKKKTQVYRHRHCHWCCRACWGGTRFLATEKLLKRHAVWLGVWRCGRHDGVYLYQRDLTSGAAVRNKTAPNNLRIYCWHGSAGAKYYDAAIKSDTNCL